MAKTSAIYPRYLAQRRACRAGFREYGHLYPQKVLFIAGLPKSGTTWLEKMISSYPGFHELLIPDPPRNSPAYDLAYELPSDMFSRFDRMLVLTKMHIPGTNHNAQLLRTAGVPYVVMFRDLRDVAVSLYFYVRQTRWHPLFRDLHELDLQEGLRFFADRLLEPYAEWIRSWIHNSDPDLGLVLRYEDVLREPEKHVAAVATHFELDTSAERVRAIVDAHSFQRMSGGRSADRRARRVSIERP